jgi:hypothetical protein
VLPPAPNPGRVDQPAAGDKKRPANEKTDQVWEKALAPETWSNWALFIAAGVAAAIALRTLNAIKEQARIARLGLSATRVAANAAKESASTAKRALEITQSADVSVIAITSSDDGRILPGSVIEIVAKNHGRTRAEGVTINNSFSIGDRTITIPPPPPFFLPAEAVHSMQTGQAFHWLAEYDFAGIETRKSILSLLVEVRYQDVFGVDQLFKAHAAFLVGRGFVIAGNESSANPPEVQEGKDT